MFGVWSFSQVRGVQAFAEQYLINRVKAPAGQQTLPTFLTVKLVRKYTATQRFSCHNYLIFTLYTSKTQQETSQVARTHVALAQKRNPGFGGQLYATQSETRAADTLGAPAWHKWKAQLHAVAGSFQSAHFIFGDASA